MYIDESLLDNLLEAARQNPRKRMNLDLRNSSEDGSQRMLNALEPDTILPIHRHCSSSETVVLLRGCMDEIFYDDEKRETARFRLNPREGRYGLNIPAGQWHGIEVLEPTVIIEMKDGPYTPLLPEDVLK
jgi:cupin fold WbuC family metalloprotein